MKKKIIFILPVLCLLLIIISRLNTSYSLNNTEVRIKDLSRNTKIINSFDKSYEITYKLDNTNNIQDEIIELTKKTTYLLLGPTNNTDELPENYYKRKRALSGMIYKLDIPRDPNDPSKPDENSKEYSINLGVSIIVGKTFQMFEDANFIYNEFGDITINQYNDFIISSIKLNNAKIKSSNPDNPREYIYETDNYMIHYFFRKVKDEYKIYYLYGESEDEYNEYYNTLEGLEVIDSLAIAPTNTGNLESIYDFSKLKALTDERIRDLYNKNISNTFYLNSYYNLSVVASGVGILINDGIVVTTWDFLENALENGQFIAISDNFGKSYDMEGIITANPDNNLVLIKLKEKLPSTISIGNINELHQTDPVITLSNNYGISAVAKKGIIASIGNYLYSTISLTENDTGAPLIDTNGNIIGIATAKTINSTISNAIPSTALEEIKNKFNNIDFDSIKTITFEEIKEKYYYVEHGKEKIENELPSSIWNKFSKIGNLKEYIKIPITKASYNDNTLSLRYKNSLSNIISGMHLSEPFRQELIKSGYKEIFASSKKCIYENKKYRILITDEFDYLIIVMVSL